MGNLCLCCYVRLDDKPHWEVPTEPTTPNLSNDVSSVETSKGSNVETSKGSSSPQSRLPSLATPLATPVEKRTGDKEKPESYNTNEFTSFVSPSLTDTSMRVSNSQTNTFSKPSSVPPVAGFMLDVGVEAAIIKGMKKDRKGFLEPPPSPKVSDRHKRHQKFNNTMKTGYILNRLTKQPKPKPFYAAPSRSDFSSSRSTAGLSTAKYGRNKYPNSSSKYGKGKYNVQSANKRHRSVALTTGKSSARPTRIRRAR